MKNIYKIIIALIVLVPTVAFGAIAPTSVNQGNGFINPLRINDRIEASSFIASSTSSSSIFNGLVGVGTTSPIVPLDVLSTTGQALSVTGGVSGLNIAQFSRRAGVSADVFINAFGGDPQLVFSRLGTSGFSIGDDTGVFKISGSGAIGTSDILSATASGNVGIGTTSPRFPLQIAATTTPQLVLTSNGLTETNWAFRNAGGNMYITGSNPVTFATSTNPAISLSPALSQVGIGTSTVAAGAGLTVAGNSNPVSILLDSISATGMYTIYRNASVDMGYIGSAGVLFTGTGGAKTEFAVRGSSAVTMGVGTGEDMRIASNGFVGVGTTSPYARLSVVGEVVGSHFTATSTTATSTFAGGVDFRTATVQQKDDKSFGIASSTWTSTSTRQLGAITTLQTWNSATCYTTGGTLNVVFGNGTNSTNMIQASSTPATFALTSNNRFVAGSKSQVSVGTPATSPTEISCTINYTSNI